MKHNCPNDKAAVVNGVYLTGCKLCLITKRQSTDYANKYRRDRMREDHRGDMVQRYDGESINPEYIKLHPEKSIEAFGMDEVERVTRK